MDIFIYLVIGHSRHTCIMELFLKPLDNLSSSGSRTSIINDFQYIKVKLNRYPIIPCFDTRRHQKPPGRIIEYQTLKPIVYDSKGDFFRMKKKWTQ